MTTLPTRLLYIYSTVPQFRDAAARGVYDVVTVFADGALCHNPDHGETFDITFVAG